MSALSKALFTETQSRILGLLFAHPDRSFYFKQILRETGMGVATIKRELDRMLDAGIVEMDRVGNQHHYRANKCCPIFGELLSIIKKTLGVVEVLRSALAPMTREITRAFIFGSVASGTERETSDVDLLVIGDIEFYRLVEVLHPCQEMLGREVNPKLFRQDEWDSLVLQHDGFVLELMNKPRMDVIGNTDGFEQSLGNQFGKS